MSLGDEPHTSWRERLKPTWSQDVRANMSQFATFRLTSNLGYGPYTKSILLLELFPDEHLTVRL